MSRTMPPSNSRRAVSGSNVPSPPDSPQLPDPAIRYLETTNSRNRTSKLPTPTRQRSSQSLRSSGHSSRSSSSLSNYRGEGGGGGQQSRIPVLSTSAIGGSRQSSQSPTKRASFVQMAGNNSPTPRADGSDDQTPRTRPTITTEGISNRVIPRSTLLGRNSLFTKPRRNESLSKKLSGRDEASESEGRNRRFLGSIDRDLAIDESAVDEGFSEEEDIMGGFRSPTSTAASNDQLHSYLRKAYTTYSEKTGGSGVRASDVVDMFATIIGKLEDAPPADWKKHVLNALDNVEEDALDYDTVFNLYMNYFRSKNYMDTPSNRRNYRSLRPSDSRRTSNASFEYESPRTRDSSRAPLFSPSQAASKLEELNKKYEQAISDLEAKTAKCDALTEDYHDLQLKYRDLEAGRDERVEELSATKRKSEKTIKSLEEELKRKEAAHIKAVTTLEDGLVERNTKISVLEKTIARAEERIQLLDREAEDNARALQDSERHFKTLKDMKSQLADKEKMVAELKKKLQTEQEDKGKFKKEREDMYAEKRDVEKRLDQAEKRCQVLESRLQALQLEEDPKKLAALPALGTGIDRISTREALHVLKERQAELEDDLRRTVTSGADIDKDEIVEERLQYEQLKRLLNRKSELLSHVEGEKNMAELRAQEAIEALERFQKDMESAELLSAIDRAEMLKKVIEMEGILKSNYDVLESTEEQKKRAEKKADDAIKELLETQKKSKLKEMELSEDYKKRLLQQRQELEKVIKQMDRNLQDAKIQTPSTRTTTTTHNFPSLEEYPSIVRYLISPFGVFYELYRTRFALLRKNRAYVIEMFVNLVTVLFLVFLTLALISLTISNYRERTLWGEKNGVFIREKLFSMRCLRLYNGYGGGYYQPGNRYFNVRAYDGFRQWIEDSVLRVPRLAPS